MNVLADRHHSGLFHSLQLLARRLGWRLFTPRGHEWWDEWYWSFGRSTYGDDRLARQFLEPETVDAEFPDWPIATVTLPEAQTMDWSYVIATVPDNEAGFAKFAAEHDAVYVVQVGNTGQTVDWNRDPIALVTSEAEIKGRGLLYRQEMDPIAFAEPVDIHSAASFVNCMSSMGDCWTLLEKARRQMTVDVYGIDGEHGVVKPYSRLIELMGHYGWGWHDKAQGDGFGHVIHSWAAVGRPLIGHASHYRGRMAEVFWDDGVTSLDLDRHSVSDIVERVRSITADEHLAMCREIRRRFEEVTRYDEDAERIAELLGLRQAVAA